MLVVPILNQNNALVFIEKIFDATQTGEIILIPSQSNLKWSPVVNCRFLVESISGAGILPTLSIGHNPSGYDNLLGSSLLAGLTAVDKGQTLAIISSDRIDLASKEIKLKISIASTYTTLMLKIILSGKYETYT